MRVKDLKEMLDLWPQDAELIILDVTDPDPEESINLEGQPAMSQPDAGGPVYLLLRQ